MYFKKLIGEKCYLSPIDCNDAPKYTEWLNDQEVVKYLPISYFMISLSSEEEILTRIAKDHNYAIVDKEKDELIGNVGLNDINNIYRTAEIGIFIGNKKYWNKGFGSEAMCLLIDYAYSILNLHNIFLRTYKSNLRALKCYENIGFKRAGEIREGVLINQEYQNVILMDLLPNEFYMKQKNKEF